MVSRSQILDALPQALTGVDIPGLGGKESGKVRDFYIQPDKRIIVTTDRQSAFDVMLGTIPYKGAVLNQLAAWWFGQTEDIVPNHVLSVPDPNVTFAANCEPIPVEMVVRGYLTGSTKTSIWHSYEKGDREIYGLRFPDGMRKNDPLPQPVITPTTHGGGPGGHDERLTRQQIIEQGIVDGDLYAEVERIAFELFARGTELCKNRGVILVDTKYEFGLLDGKVTLMDEIHTPDSSRFWIADSYPHLHEQKKEPENFDKEFLRLWYADHGYRGDGDPPPMPEDLAVATAERYIAVYEKLAGKEFESFDYPIEERIIANIQAAV